VDHFGQYASKNGHIRRGWTTSRVDSGAVYTGKPRDFGHFAPVPAGSIVAQPSGL